MTGNERPDQRALLQRAFLELKQLRAELDAVHGEAIAIIGLGCRMPGGGDDPQNFWRVLRDGVDAVRDLPTERWNLPHFEATLRSLNPLGPTKIVGGFLEQVSGFEPAFFGISPREAATMDPQQRLMLEVTWEALDDAGQSVERLRGSKTGVFVGVHSQSSDYFIMQVSDPAALDTYSGTGTAHSVLAGRVSYCFDLRGPSVAVDTACSSSLVAAHLACASLRNRESDLAVAGGVNLRLSPAFFLATSRMGTGSGSGRCRVFDAAADGVVTGEGCGVVVLKRLSDALRDGDPIWAVVRGSAVNQDGTSAGLTAPNVQAQQAVLREALRNARVSGAQIGLVETHGTGTVLGDPMEVEALAAVLGGEGSARCALGAVKSNIGHLEGAAGIAGLIKAVLALHHQVIPPNIHFEELNPHIGLGATRFVIPTAPLPWPAVGDLRLAGVSSFGWSGTNAHVILEEAPRVQPEPELEQRPAATEPPRAYLLPLSAPTSAGLVARARQLEAFLGGAGASLALSDLCWTAATRRTHHEQRLSVTGSSHAELGAALRAYAEGEARAGVAAGRASQSPRIVFVFPGQGSQWLGMARQLLHEEPSFRAALERCEQAFAPHVEWSLLPELLGTSLSPRLEQIDCIQPCLFAIQVALAEQWRAWGIRPSAVVGHSMGEVAAAHVAGALTLEDAARVICTRSRLLRRISGQGAMALVELDLDAARAAIAGREDRISVAVSNSSRSTVLSGERAALADVIEALGSREVFCRWIKVDVASHSPQVEPLEPALLAELGGLAPRAGEIPILSTVTGELGDGSGFDARYWIRNLREPVLFSSAVQQLLASDHAIFVELSPHPVLLPAIEQTLLETNHGGVVVPSLRREEPERASLLTSLGLLHANGAAPDWQRLYEGEARAPRAVRLPSHPFQREDYTCFTHGPPNIPGGAGSAHGHASDHALLGLRLEPGVAPDTWIWQTRLDAQRFDVVREHRVGGALVLPAAAYLDMALAAGREALSASELRLESVAFERLLALAEGGETFVQVVVIVEGASAASFRVLSRSASAGAWLEHASGRIRASEPRDHAAVDLGALRRALAEPRSHEQHYDFLREHGIEYGASFRGVEAISRRDGEALATLALPAAASDPLAHCIHPALLDAAFQVLTAARPPSPASRAETWVPVFVRSFELFRPVPRRVLAHVRLEDGGASDSALSCDVALLNEEGELLAAARGLRSERLEPTASADAEPLSAWLYELTWEQRPLPNAPRADAAADWLLSMDRRGVGERLAAALEACGQRVERVQPNASPAELRGAIQGRRFRGAVHLGSLDQPELEERASPTALQRDGTLSALAFTQALLRHADEPPRLWLLSAGAQPVPGIEAGSGGAPLGLAQTPLWGFGRTAALEHPELACVRVDLGHEPERDVESLVRELLASTPEDQVALRGDRRYVARLVHPAAASDAAPRELVPAAETPFRLELASPGTLETFECAAHERRPPGPGEVEIEVEAAGLNFLDVLSALGAIPEVTPRAPGEPLVLGGECAGRIVALGPGVTTLSLGEEVVAIASPAMATHVLARAELVLPKPRGFSAIEAATMPIAFTTAHFALTRVATLAAGERVLIHAAAGGVGLAAVTLARALGAEVFATAGSPEKRAFLRELGVKHVMDSRSLDFADEVRAATGGEGVDVVLNSLSGAFIPASFALLRSYGRFVEIGKRDYYEDRRLGLRPFLRNLSFTLVDLLGLARERPAAFRAAFAETLTLLERERLGPLPHQAFPIARAREAFLHMAQARHIGKVVVSFAERRQTPIARSCKQQRTSQPRADATYLISGGLGGLGLTLARWLVERGARHLLLVGRREPDAPQRASLDRLRDLGADVRTARADVAVRAEVERLLADARAELPALCGVFHCAVVLDDATVLEQSEARFTAVMAPKLDGAWNLHQATLEAPLDWFVMFSSGASLLGSPGQANYAAANAFLDGLAHERQRLGRPGLSINWGPWAEVGLAAATALRGERLAFRGLASIAPELGLAALARALEHGGPELAFLPLNLRQWRQFYPKSAELPLFSQLAEHAHGGAVAEPAFEKALRAAAPAERRELLEQHLIEQLSRVLRAARGRIERDTPFSSMGLDSLMALELRNRVEASLRLTLPATLVWAHPSVARLAASLSTRLGLELERPPEPRAETTGPAPVRRAEPDQALSRALESVGGLSEQDALEALLNA